MSGDVASNRRDLTGLGLAVTGLVFAVTGLGLAVTLMLVTIPAGFGRAFGTEPGGPVIVPLDSVPGTVRLAATGNGQTLFCLDGAGGGIVAIDPLAAGRVREVITPPGPTCPRPVAVAAIDTAVVAAVCRDGERWELRTWRLRPDEPVAAEAPMQTIPLGTAAGGADTEVDLAVDGGRRWIAISGLPPPLAPVLRAPLARMHVGPLTNRSCPTFAAAERPVAVTGGPHDELVLFEQANQGEVVMSYHDHDGRCLLRLPTGLGRIRDAAFTPGGGGLWVLADDARGTSGLWRLDATLREGRQAIRPTLVVPRAAPLALAVPTERAVVICHAAGQLAGDHRIERLDLSAPADGPASTPPGRGDDTERPADGGDTR